MWPRRILSRASKRVHDYDLCAAFAVHRHRGTFGRQASALPLTSSEKRQMIGVASSSADFICRYEIEAIK